MNFCLCKQKFIKTSVIFEELASYKISFSMETPSYSSNQLPDVSELTEKISMQTTQSFA